MPVETVELFRIDQTTYAIRWDPSTGDVFVGGDLVFSKAQSPKEARELGRRHASEYHAKNLRLNTH